MLPRVLEPEAMDSPEEAIDYDAMDHSAVNSRFVADFLAVHGRCRGGEILDVGTGPGRIPIELCRVDLLAIVRGVDLAPTMLRLAAGNVAEAGLSDRIGLELVDAKSLPYPDGEFEAVLSNTIIHHIPDPAPALAEMTRILAPGGTLMVRDLARPDYANDVAKLVEMYAAGESDSARALFDASLHAALRVQEMQAIILALGFAPAGVTMTSDRHWTWIWQRPSNISTHGPDRR